MTELPAGSRLLMRFRLRPDGMLRISRASETAFGGLPLRLVALTSLSMVPMLASISRRCSMRSCNIFVGSIAIPFPSKYLSA